MGDLSATQGGGVATGVRGRGHWRQVGLGLRGWLGQSYAGIGDDRTGWCELHRTVLQPALASSFTPGAGCNKDA